MKKIIKSGILVAAASLFFVGCAGNQPKCVPGSQFSGDHNKCVVTNIDLKAVVKSKTCENHVCTGVILDERGRHIKVSLEETAEVGDTVTVVLYKSPKEGK